MSEKVIELRPIKESRDDYDKIEAKIKAVFKKLVYYPLLAELDETKTKLVNASDSALADALRMGRVTFSEGAFSGRLSSAVSRELRELGAEWNRGTYRYKIPLAKLPMSIRSAISASESRFKDKLEAIDRKIAQFLPEQIAGSIQVADNFSSAIWKVDKDFRESVKTISIAPNLTKEQRERLADEWQNNMRLWIRDFSEKEISNLRGKIQKAAFAGDRRETLIKTIQSSYGVTANKAKFLARQETSLLMTELKQTRYKSAGVEEYKWRSVAGTPAHPVRHQHKKLAEASDRGKIYRWDDPPVTTEPGEPERRNNPGRDYNCRCFAIPVVRFKKKA